VTVYAKAVTSWRATGLGDPLPLGIKSKIAPPSGFTGEDGMSPTDADYRRWTEMHPDGNVAVRVSENVVGIDVDTYIKDGKQKQGGTTLAKIEAAHGELPVTFISTSREGISGIRLFTADPTLIEDFPGIAGPDIEIIKHGHRYFVAYPSIHPEGGQYNLYYDGRCVTNGGDETLLPTVNDLPRLPDDWIRHLLAEANGGCYCLTNEEPNFNHEDVDWSRNEAKYGTIDKAVKALEGTLEAGSSRYDTARDVALFLLGNSTPLALKELQRLRSLYVEAVQDSREGGQRTAEAEWDRFVAGAEKITGNTVNDPEEREGSSWSEIDLSRIDPDRIPEPAILFRDDLQPILYPGVRNVLFGPSESAKSWFAAHAIQQEADHLEGSDPGGTRKAAVIIDFEDIPEVWRVAYHRPIDPPTNNEITQQLGNNLRQVKLVVVDSMNESTYLFGLSISSNDDIGEWRNKFLRPIESNLNPDDPAAILVIDHTGHDENINRRASIGAVTKLTGVRGVQIWADVIEQPAPGKHGAIGLYVMKDTNGKVRSISRTEPDGKQYLGTFIIDPLSDLTGRIVASIVNPGLEAVEPADLEIILDLFAKHDSGKGLSMNQVEKLSIGRLKMAARKKRLLVKHAAENGDLDTFPSGQGIRYRLSEQHRKEASGGSSHNGTMSDEHTSSGDWTNPTPDEAETHTQHGLKFVGRTPDEPRRGTSSQSLVPSLPIRDEVGDEPEDFPIPY